VKPALHKVLEDAADETGEVAAMGSGFSGERLLEALLLALPMGDLAELSRGRLRKKASIKFAKRHQQPVFGDSHRFLGPLIQR